MGLFYLILGGLEKRKNTWSTSGSNVIEKSLFNCVPFFIQLNSNINNHSLLLSKSLNALCTTPYVHVMFCIHVTRTIR